MRERESERLYRLVPLRAHRYRRLSEVLKAAQRQGRTVRDVAAELAREAPMSLEAALLLRDIWEVLRITTVRAAQERPQITHTVEGLLSRLMRRPFGGEEVLF